MKDELGGKTMKEYVGLGPKTYSYLKENNDENKKAKDTEHKRNHLEKNEIDVDSLKEDKK